MSSEEKILITSALLYANGPLHFGHLAGAYLPADIYARFKRLSGSNVLYICGSDEYGVAITLSAEKAGRTPQEHIDLYHKVNEGLFQKMNFSFDHYSRTTNKFHKPLTQSVFKDLNKNGFIEKKETEQLYSTEEDRFLADRYVTGECPKCGFDKARGDECPKCGASYDAMDIKNPKSMLTGSPLTKKKTTHWFFRLDLLKDKLASFIKHKDWRDTVHNFILPYIEDLRPRAITRDFDWGVPVPLDDAVGKVFYVWFDAVLGYISITQEWAHEIGSPDKWKDYWLDSKTKHVEFIGKDNIAFHAMFFPAMIMGQDQPIVQVHDLPANEFLNLEGKQFSKSSGWYIDLAEFLENYPVDTIRYALAANAPETSDAEFTWADFQMRVNTELVGKFGNYIYRTLAFLTTKMDGKIPECHDFSTEDSDFLAKIDDVVNEIQQCYEQYKVRKAVTLIMELASHANTYFDHKKPWALIKDKDTKEDLETTMYCCLTAAKALAVVTFPIMPESSEKIWKMLGNRTSLDNENWQKILEDELVPGTDIENPTILFSKIEDEQIEKERAKLESTEAPLKESNLKDQIKYDDFAKLDLRVGRIETAEKVEKSKKLLVMRVNLGFEKRQIVSGIAQTFEDPSVLVDRKVIVVANLKPAKLMGIESQGMILAAADDTFLELPGLKDAPEGMSVS